MTMCILGISDAVTGYYFWFCSVSFHLGCSITISLVSSGVFTTGIHGRYQQNDRNVPKDEVQSMKFIATGDIYIHTKRIPHQRQILQGSISFIHPQYLRVLFLENNTFR